MSRVPNEAGIDIERRIHPMRVQHSQRLILVGVAIVKLYGHNCLCRRQGLRVMEQHEHTSGEKSCCKDQPGVPGDAVSSRCLHYVLLQAVICHANAKGEVAVRSTAGSTVDQDWTLSWNSAETPLN